MNLTSDWGNGAIPLSRIIEPNPQLSCSLPDTGFLGALYPGGPQPALNYTVCNVGCGTLAATLYLQIYGNIVAGPNTVSVETAECQTFTTTITSLGQPGTLVGQVI